MAGGFGALRTAAYDAAGRQQQRQLFMGMDAYERHRKMVHDLVAYYGMQMPQGGQAAPEKSDFDILQDNHRFIRSDEDDAADSWEVRLAKRYYSKLFKEYAIADLSRYKEGKVGLRWRTQREVVAGRGQFVCGAKGCEERRGLASFEVPFAYQEAGERRQALVKVRVCPTHAYQLNYRKHKEAERAHKQRQRRQRRKEERRQRRRTSSSSSGKNKKRRRRGDSSSGSSSDEEGSSSSSSSGSSSSSDSSQDEQRSSGRKRRRGGEQEQPQLASGSKRKQGAAAAAAGARQPEVAATAGAAAAPAENDLDAFLQGLFE